jgi:thioredoxin-related protein
MNVKQVLRIEAEDGWGMFRNHPDHLERETIDQINYNVYDRHCSMNNPYQDGLNMTDDHFCAYASLEMMEKWLTTEEIREILSYDYNIYLIELTEWQEGKHNVIFKQEHVKSKINISDLFQ